MLTLRYIDTEYQLIKSANKNQLSLLNSDVEAGVFNNLLKGIFL